MDDMCGSFVFGLLERNGANWKKYIRRENNDP